MKRNMYIYMYNEINHRHYHYRFPYRCRLTLRLRRTTLLSTTLLFLLPLNGNVFQVVQLTSAYYYLLLAVSLNNYINRFLNYILSLDIYQYSSSYRHKYQIHDIMSCEK